MAQSLFKTLKRQDPQVEIDVVAPGWSEPLLARMPEINRTHPLAVSHGKLDLSARWGLGRRLRQQHYDQAIVLPRSAKSALVPWLAGIPRRTGYRGEHRYGLLNDRRELNRLEHYRTVDRFIALANDGHTQAVNPPQPELTSSRDQQAAAMHALVWACQALAK
jgi:heptosyltransferase-2